LVPKKSVAASISVFPKRGGAFIFGFRVGAGRETDRVESILQPKVSQALKSNGFRAFFLLSAAVGRGSPNKA